MPHAGYNIVSPSIYVLAWQSMNKFNSMPSNKFSAFEVTDVCRNFQTIGSLLFQIHYDNECVSRHYYGIIHVKN